MIKANYIKIIIINELILGKKTKLLFIICYVVYKPNNKISWYQRQRFLINWKQKSWSSININVRVRKNYVPV